MALSLLGWTNAFTTMSIFIFGLSFGFFCIYNAKKSNAKLLFYMGLIIVFCGLAYLGNVCDFITILLTGKNLDNSYGQIGLLSEVWYGPAGIAMVFFTAELFTPRKKWYIIIPFIVAIIIMEIFIFIDPGSITYIYPEKSGENLIEDNLAFDSVAGVIYLFGMLSITVFWGSGCLIRSIKSSGILRKKYILLLLAILALIIANFLEVESIIIFIVLGRITFIGFFLLLYLGVREESEKKEKVKPEKEVRVEGDLFRISEYKKEDITEEEISISKEKKICLVCKGKLGGFTVFLCTGCATFYCHKCAKALIQLENACWACNAPIDKSKPVKPFKTQEEMEEIKISEKPKK